MPEPATTAASSAATIAAVASGTLTIAGHLYGVPVDALLAGVVGAGIAVAQAERVGPGRAALLAAVVLFVTALVSAVLLGPLAGLLLDDAVRKATGVDLPDAAVRAASCFVTALGAQRWLRRVVDVMSGQINTPGKGTGNGNGTGGQA